MKIVTLINDSGRVIRYIPMIHVGESSKMKSIIKCIDAHTENGYIHLFEGVRESKKGDVMRLLGYDCSDSITLKTLYSLLADILGMVSQPIFKESSVVVCADIETSEIPEEYYPDTLEPLDIDHEDIEMLKSGITGKISRAVLKIGYDLVRFLSYMGLIHTGKGTELFLVNKMREQKLLKMIGETRSNVIITYGAAHKKAILEGLYALDTSFRIVQR